VTTIAWRMMHVAGGCFWNRASAFFGDGSVPADADMFDPRHLPADLPTTAAGGIAFLEQAYHRWHDAIEMLDEPALREPLGVTGSFFAQEPMAGLVLHLNREAMHHGGEIGALRDLYRAGLRAPAPAKATAPAQAARAGPAARDGKAGQGGRSR
jgi:hypothetical protein